MRYMNLHEDVVFMENLLTLSLLKSDLVYLREVEGLTPKMMMMMRIEVRIKKRLWTLMM